MPRLKVIFHVDEISKWRLLLKNVKNILDAESETKLVVEVVANSHAVKVYDTTFDSDIDTDAMLALNHRGVIFNVCGNSVKLYDLNEDNLLDFVDVVPSGVMHLAIRQHEGYSYIKP